jgi:hypothetical protein
MTPEENDYDYDVRLHPNISLKPHEYRAQRFAYYKGKYYANDFHFNGEPFDEEAEILADRDMEIYWYVKDEMEQQSCS